jgi:hypothetical protein
MVLSQIPVPVDANRAPSLLGRGMFLFGSFFFYFHYVLPESSLLTAVTNSGEDILVLERYYNEHFMHNHEASFCFSSY